MKRRHDFTRPSPLHLAKDRLRIPALWRLRQWSGEPGKSCRVPYRPDQAASGSIFKDGLLFNDFAANETLDAPALLARVEGLERAEACKLFIALAGVRSAAAGSAPPVRQLSSEPSGAVLVCKPALPRLATLTERDMLTLAEVRRISLDAVLRACASGLVWKCWWRGHHCWVITDSARWVAQARRMDRQRFSASESNRDGPKAWTFKGGRAGWPVGIADAAGMPGIALVEGGPDLLAAFHFIATEGRKEAVMPVAMLGASARIVEDALPLFRGKRVRIFYHADPPKDGGRSAGIEAAFRWQFQLTAAGATVDAFDLSCLRMTDGAPVNDLNDLTRCHPDDWQAEREELETLMHF